MLRYHVTADKMRESPNIYIKINGVSNYCSANLTSGIKDLFIDYKRGVMVFGKQYAEPEEFKDFQQFIKEQLSSEQFEQLKLYSQRCMYFMGFPPTIVPIELGIEDVFIRQAEKKDCQYSIEKKDEIDQQGQAVSVIYQKIHVSRYPIYDSFGYLLGYIEGPAEALFKLTDQGFQLQYFQTDSDFIRDLYLEKMTAAEFYKKMLQELQPIRRLHYIKDTVIDALQEQINVLKHSPAEENLEKIRVIEAHRQVIVKSIDQGCEDIRKNADPADQIRTFVTVKNQVGTDLTKLIQHPVFEYSPCQQLIKCFFDLMAFIGCLESERADFYANLRRKDSRYGFFKLRKSVDKEPLVIAPTLGLGVQ